MKLPSPRFKKLSPKSRSRSSLQSRCSRLLSRLLRVRQAACCPRQQGQGGFHASIRPGASSQAATRLRGRRPICPADRHRRARPVSGGDAGAGCPGLQGQTEGVISMARALRFGSAISFIALASVIAGCAAPQSHVRTAGFGGKANGRDRSRHARHGRAQLEQRAGRDRVRRAGGREDAERRGLPRFARQRLFRRRPLSSRPKPRTRIR